MNSTIKEAASRLYEAELNKTECLPVRELIGIDTINEAYEVQNLNTIRRLKSGARLIGRKIGLTSFAVQKQLRVDQPDYGMLFSDMEVMEGGTITWAECMQPKAEGEIAFILNTDLNHSNISIAEVISSIEYAVPCIEIVGSRIAHWDIKITDTIADNASASHFVIGHSPKTLSEFDILKCKMQLFKNGELSADGDAKACMGSPINATWWLANKMTELGQPLKKGDIVLAGALGPMVEAKKGDEFVASFSNLGSVSINFGL